jgi:cytoskeletal protein CcmA (bactofilin family)
MKHMNKLLTSRKMLLCAVVLLASIIGGLGWAGVARTQAVTNNVKKDKTVDSSLYSAGDQIVIDGTVNGDVHCAGQNVMINGTVNGDVLCAAQTLTVKGTVSGSIRAAAQEITIKGRVGHSVTLAAERLHIDKTAHIAQDATLFAGESNLYGTFGRDVVLSGGAANVHGTVGRNVVYNGSALHVLSAAHIHGTVRYESSRSIQIDDSAKIAGTVTREKQNKDSSGFNVALLLGVLAAAYIFAMLLVMLWPQAIHTTSDIAVRSLGKVMLVGILAAFIAPFAVLLVGATLIGIPVAVFLALAGCLLALLSGPVAAYYLGSMILSRSKNALAIMAVGAAVLLAVYCIPVVGVIAAMIAYFIGSGSVLIAFKRRMAKPDYRVV